jgi:hypothetical protein
MVDTATQNKIDELISRSNNVRADAQSILNVLEYGWSNTILYSTTAWMDVGYYYNSNDFYNDNIEVFKYTSSNFGTASGVISESGNTGTLTGTSTSFLSDMSAGDYFIAGDDIFEVVSVEDDTSLTYTPSVAIPETTLSKSTIKWAKKPSHRTERSLWYENHTFMDSLGTTTITSNTGIIIQAGYNSSEKKEKAPPYDGEEKNLVIDVANNFTTNVVNTYELQSNNYVISTTTGDIDVTSAADINLDTDTTSGNIVLTTNTVIIDGTLQVGTSTLTIKSNSTSSNVVSGVDTKIDVTGSFVIDATNETSFVTRTNFQDGLALSGDTLNLPNISRNDGSLSKAKGSIIWDTVSDDLRFWDGNTWERFRLGSEIIIGEGGGETYVTTSVTNHTIGTGSKTFTVADNDLSYTAGQSIIAAYDGSNYMLGTVTSYSGTTLIMNVTSVVGSGTYSSWSINLDGATAGPIGYTGSAGTDGTNGTNGTSGADGYTGSTGFTGSKGDPGGYTGSKGDTGSTGFTGSASTVAGPIGYTGSQGIGYTGSKGDQGIQGDTGFTGSRGFTGSKGDQGVIGFTGSKGDQGDQGIIGYTGSQGPRGYTGSQGPRGFTGSKGDQGDQGVIGFTGSQGLIGYTGSQGPRGYTGSQGAIGYTGSQGIQGYTGSQGPRGYTGSQGIQGYTGSQGIQGYTGSQGPRGYTGSKGDIGFTGSQGLIGYTGSQGFTGSQGITGYTGSKGDRYLTSSTTSLSISTGSKSLTVETGLSYSKTQTVRIVNSVNNYMEGTVTSYNSGTGALVIDVDTIVGSGTFSSWEVNLAGAVGGGVVGGATVTTSTSAPSSPGDGDLWWNEEEGQLKIYYDDGDTSQWVDASSGAIGDQGYTGSKGDQGIQGDTGSIGYTGSQGIQGYTGSQGPIGYTGSQGPIGYTGSQGPRGYTGSQGPIGYTGSKGDTGFTGSAGSSVEVVVSNTAPSSPSQGDLWFDSDDGLFSVYYNDGTSSQWVVAAGQQGIRGYTGSKGADGTIGVDGYTGSQGYTGSAGPSDQLNTTDDTATTSLYPVMVGTVGSDTDAKTTSSKLIYNASAGTLTTTNFNSTSDISLKEDVKTIQNGLEKIDNINPVSFKWISGGRSNGVIAQEVENVLPEIVSEVNGLKSVSYDQLIPFLISAVKELKEQNVSLSNQVEDLKSKIENLS